MADDEPLTVEQVASRLACSSPTSHALVRDDVVGELWKATAESEAMRPILAEFVAAVEAHADITRRHRAVVDRLHEMLQDGGLRDAEKALGLDA